jgi:hypothetical protein
MSKQSSVSPIDDLTFDVITVLRNKARALAVYDQYLSDADAEDEDELHDLFIEMRRQDEEHVLVLKEVLARRLEDDLGYDDIEDVDDDITDEDDDIGEDYDEADEDEVEEPSSTDVAARGDDAGLTPPVASPPGRGESTERR